MIPDWLNPYWITDNGVESASELLRPLVGLSIVAWAVFGISRHRDAGQRLAVGVVGGLWMLIGIVAVDLLPTAVSALGWGSLDWWTYVGDAPRLGATPVDLLIPWALAWGMLPLALWSVPRPLPLVAVFGAVDLIVMPQLGTVVDLGPRWLVGQLVLLVLVALPGLTLVNLMRSERRLAARTVMLAALFAVMFLGLVPLIAQTLGGVPVSLPPVERTAVLAQIMLVLGLPGLAAVRELYQRGQGTPYPWDPPLRVVSTGPYAYVANPMQLSMTVLMAVLGAALWHWPLALAAATGLAFSIAVAEPHERSVLGDRWGLAWDRYSASHRAWLPTWRPRFAEDYHAVVYIDGGCGVCRAVGEWILKRDPVGVHIADARYAPGPVMHRITYRSFGSDDFQTTGIRAFAAALDHINLGWAAVGWGLRLPAVGWWAQLIADTMVMAPHAAVAPDLAPLEPLAGPVVTVKLNGGPTPERRATVSLIAADQAGVGLTPT